MRTEIYTSDGKLQALWDDATLMYEEYSPTGVLTFQRPYTAEESAAMSARVARETNETNESSIRTATETRLAQLDAEIISKTNAELFTQSGTGAALKLLARTLRLVIRLLIRRFDGVD